MGSYYAGMMNATGGSELRHFGILGQKWGVRRFQNADGTLTAAGKERYGGSEDSESKTNATSESVTKWFGSNNLSSIRNDMRQNGASTFDEYINSITDDPKSLRSEMDKRSNEIRQNLGHSYHKISDNLPDGDINAESLELKLGLKGDDYKYVRNCVSNAFETVGYNKYKSEYDKAKSRKNASLLGGFENSKVTKDFRNAQDKFSRASRDVEGLSLSAAFDYIEKLPKSDQDTYKAYLYCLMGYDW